MLRLFCINTHITSRWLWLTLWKQLFKPAGKNWIFFNFSGVRCLRFIKFLYPLIFIDYIFSAVAEFLHSAERRNLKTQKDYYLLWRNGRKLNIQQIQLELNTYSFYYNSMEPYRNEGNGQYNVSHQTCISVCCCCPQIYINYSRI